MAPVTQCGKGGSVHATARPHRALLLSDGCGDMLGGLCCPVGALVSDSGIFLFDMADSAWMLDLRARQGARFGLLLTTRSHARLHPPTPSTLPPKHNIAHGVRTPESPPT